MKASIEVNVYRPGKGTSIDFVANEVPVALEYNGISHAVMLCTPTDLQDFGLGFSLSEGILKSRQDLYDISISESNLGVTVSMEIATEAFMRLKDRRRSMTGRTGCGICGVDNLAQVERVIHPINRTSSFPLEALYNGIDALTDLQLLQKETGASHAACFVRDNGNIELMKEDVGRHNALDKCLGALSSQFNDLHGAMIVTSRASLEMVQKTAALGLGVLAAVSAPTYAAIELAERLNVSLIGFLRNRQCVIYTHPEYIAGVY